MKLLKRQIEKDGSGSIKLRPEESEDLWHCYHLITIGDQVTATTVRRVVRESSTGSTTSEKVRLTLTLLIDAVDFDPQAGTLRLKGKNRSDNQHIKMNASHTLDLEINRTLTIIKDVWDEIALKRVKDSCDPSTSADVAAIVMQEGQALVCLIKPHMTLVQAKVECSIPRKRRGSTAQHDKALERFFGQIMQAILRVLKFDILKVVLVASPGFLRDQFLAWMWLEATRTENKILMENRSKFLSVHSSSGHKHALNEVLADASVRKQLADTAAASEISALDEFFTMLRQEPDRAVYGPRHVSVAAERQAVQQLLITDELFRAATVQLRKTYLNLVKTVRESGGEVRVFSSMHPSGEQLTKLTGVAAILRFPLADELMSDDDDSEGSLSNEADRPSSMNTE